MIGDLLFIVFAVLAFFFGLGVIVARNPMYSALSLVAVLISLAGLFLLLHAEFLAWILVIVYTGAVMVLMIFVISLLNLQKEEPIQFTAIRKWGVAMIGLFGILFSIYVFQDPLVSYLRPQAAPVPPEWGAVETLAVDLFTRYLLPFELASVLLTAAVIGAVVIARKDASAKE